MRDVTVDPATRLAHVGPGCLLKDVDWATQEHGLATVLGFISEVGVAGLTLGGGLGYLTRRCGWTVDNLEAVELVTADGRVRFGANGMWEPDEPEADMFREWIRAAWKRIRPFSTGATYINFQTADEGEQRIRATYGANFNRLVEVKKRYDPDNLFRVNRNIPSE